MPSKKRATPVSLQPLDALFGTNEESINGISEIAIGSLHPFPNHPFQVRDDKKMEELAESITQYGRLGGIPICMQMNNEVVPRDANNYMHLLHKITFFYTGGHLTLEDTFGPVIWHPRSKTPQVMLDHHVRDDLGSLKLSFDYVTDLFREEDVEKILLAYVKRVKSAMTQIEWDCIVI